MIYIYIYYTKILRNRNKVWRLRHIILSKLMIVESLLISKYTKSFSYNYQKILNVLSNKLNINSEFIFLRKK